jgi:exonuclease SbcC
MLITRIELRNIKSYEDADVELEPGVTAICGHNGAGKSTLLEAIGATLFDYLPYSQAEFVRAGERWGEVAVTIRSALDEREYRVVRRFGAGATHYVFDPELGVHAAQGAEAVRRWLRQHLGIEHGAALKELFADTIGVPQGLLTAIFLEAPQQRREKFDRLLGLAEYREAVERLLPVRHELQKQRAELAGRIDRLEHDVAPRQEKEEEAQCLAAELASLNLRRAEFQQRAQELQGRVEELARLAQALGDAKGAHATQLERTEAARRQLAGAQELLRAAEEAAEIVAATARDHAAFEQIERKLEHLDAQRRERDQLRQQHTTLVQQRAGLEAALKKVKEQCAAAEAARAQLPELERLAQQQDALEGRIRELERLLHEAALLQQQADELRRDRVAKEKELHRVQRQQQELRPLAAQADRLPALRDRLRELEMAYQEAAQAAAALDEANKALAEWERQAALTGQQLAQVREAIAAIEPDLPLAARRAELRGQVRLLHQELAAATQQVRYYEEILSQVQGGLCPFLKQPCKNMEEQGVPLDAYFLGELEAARERYASVQTELAGLELALEQAEEAATRAASLPSWQQQERELVRRYQETLAQVEMYRQRAASVQHAPARQQQILHERAALVVERDRAEDAQQRIAALPGLAERERELTEDLKKIDERVASLDQEIASLQHQGAPLPGLRTELEQLGDPHGQLAVVRDRVAALPDLHRELDRLHRELDALTTEEAQFDSRLAHYAGLDERIGRALAAREKLRPAHEAYLRHEQIAAELTARRCRFDECQASLEEQERRLRACAETLEAAQRAYNPDEHDTARRELDTVLKELSTVDGQIQRNLALQEQVREELARIHAAQAELEAARAEHSDLTALDEFVEYLRSLLRQALPVITRMMVQQVSAVATRLFREIIGDGTVELVWEEDYGILVKQRATTRTFKQLSGGEQMSAALAVRLALLQALANIDVAFFDEPTQNMDAERRANLATQIPVLAAQGSGFKQLVVISHDDTFESATDYVIRIEKQDGRSVVSRA